MNKSAEIFAEQFGSLPDASASAPGRIEIIGNHTDYNGGTVVGAAIEDRLCVSCSLRDDGKIRLWSRELLEFDVDTYREAPAESWARYPLGIWDEFRLQEQLDSKTGLDLVISSDIPSGEGLSSSAALELATAIALNSLLRPDTKSERLHPSLNMQTLVRLAHRAENRFIGVPCGLLDQSVVGLAVKGSLLILDASTGRHTTTHVPENLEMVVVRSHIRHSLLNSPYERRREECRQALMGIQRVIPGVRHLAHLNPIDIAAYDVILDDALVRRARHVVEEQRRVGAFLGALASGDTGAAGGFLSASHESSKTLFENSTPEMDFLVMQLNGLQGVLGSRLTGAGWGGAVFALVNQEFDETALLSVIEAYKNHFDATPEWWRSEFCEGARLEPVEIIPRS